MAEGVSLQQTNIREAIAPWWHTVLVMAVLAGMSTAGHYQHGFPNG